MPPVEPNDKPHKSLEPASGVAEVRIGDVDEERAEEGGGDPKSRYPTLVVTNEQERAEGDTEDGSADDCADRELFDDSDGCLRFQMDGKGKSLSSVFNSCFAVEP